MAPPPSSLLRDLLAADGFKNRRKQPESSSAASRTVSMPLQQRRPTKPARSQSDVLTRSRLRDGNDGTNDGNRDADEEQTAARRASASLTSVRSYKNRDSSSGAARGTTAVPALDESALSALISLVAGAVKQFAKDEAFRASLRGGCTSCIGESNHRAVLDLRVIVQTIERAAAEAGLDSRDLKRASLKLHSMASLGTKEAHALTASGIPYERLAACAHLYMSVISKLQKKEHSSAVHVLEVFYLAPHEARTILLPALWDRLFRTGLSHLRAWRDRESAAASSDARVKDVEKMFVEVLDDGTRALACYYRDWLLGRTEAMALPSVPAPPSTALASAPRFSASTSYDIGSDVGYSSGSLSPAKLVIDETLRQPEEIKEEEAMEGKAADAESVFHECDDGEARSSTPTPRAEENVHMPNILAKETSEPQIEDERTKESAESTSYLPICDMSAIDLLTLEFCEGPLQSDTGGNPVSIFSATPSDFLCPLTRQIFNRPVTIETGQTFERHAIVQWFNKGLRVCPVTGQELESLSIPDTNRVLKRLINNWKAEHCKSLVTESYVSEDKLNETVIDKVLNSGCDMSEQIEKARHLMAIGGIDFLLRRFQEGTEDHKAQAAEHLLLCIRAEGSCRNYVAIRLDSLSVIQLLHSEVISVRSTAVHLLIELLCLRRREMVEMFIHGLRGVSVMETMNVLLQHLRSSTVQEQALLAVLLLNFDRTVDCLPPKVNGTKARRNLVYRFTESIVYRVPNRYGERALLAEEEPHRNSTYREESARVLAHSLRCCLTDENVVPNTRKALLLLGGQFSFSGGLLAEDWMLKQAGFVDDSPATPANSDASFQEKETAENEAWLKHVTAVLLGNGRRPFLAALSRCLNSPDAALVAASLTTAGWLSSSLASSPDATDMQLAAFSALIPRLKQCLAASAHQARHRVLASVTLHNFSKIPDCKVLLMLLADGLRDHLSELAELTWTAGQLSAELHE